MSAALSAAAEPVPAQVERLHALVASGRVAPLVPLASPFHLARRDAFAAAGAVLLRATASLLAEAARSELPPPEPGAQALASPLHLGPRVRRAVALELSRGLALGFTRFDLSVPPAAPEAFSVLEVQAGDPSAMGWHDALAVAFDQPPSLMPSHRRAFEAATPGRRIAFVVAKGSIVESDHRLLAQHYAQHGWQACVVDPRELSFDGAHLRAKGAPVDAVFRDALDELFVGDFARGGDALLSALEADAVVLRNPLCAALADDKRLLEPLSTPARWDPKTAAVLRRHVPWTRVVRERRVEWDGAEVDLPALLGTAQERLVLKPAEGFGGFGVVVGRHASSAEWTAAVEQALAHPGAFVAQAAVALPRQSVHFLAPSGVETREAYVVHSVWFHPHLAGAFCRASAQPVVNVHQGGGLAPVFLGP